VGKSHVPSIRGKQQNSQNGWETLLRDPPKTVFDAYEVLLKRVAASDHPLVRSMFHVMYCADRPFTLQEMNLAVHLRQTENAYSEDVDKMSDEAFRDWIIESYGLFVTENHNELFFKHEISRELLIASAESWPSLQKFTSIHNVVSNWQDHFRRSKCQRLEMIIIYEFSILKADFTKNITRYATQSGL
jgi:hypothetical protein